MEFIFEWIHSSPFYELTALISLAALIGFLGLLLRQPMIVSFIAVGIISGPSVFNIVQSHAHIEVLAQLGIAVLLFLVGLKLDLKLIRTLGPVALATGLGQVTFTSLIGFFIAKSLGFDTTASLYIAVALTFSSTIIIVKLLSDKHEVDSLHGRIAIGFLIVQDLVVVLAMMVLSALGLGNQEEGSYSTLYLISTVIMYGGLMLCFVFLFIKYFANKLVSHIAHSQELLITFAIGWAALLAAIGSQLGLSKELGGLLAGISLASTPYREAIVARLSSLREFLLLFFFIALGAQLDLSLLGTQLIPAVIFSIFVLIGNPLIVVIIMGTMGYRKRTSFLAGLTVAQISEFSLIFMAMGLSLGHVAQNALGLVILVGLITISTSVYMITYSHSLYKIVEKLLVPFERKTPFREIRVEALSIGSDKFDVIIFGLGRYGKAIAHYLHEEGLKTLAVDFNPDVVRSWKKLGQSAIYGDVSDPFFIHSLPLKKTKLIISAIAEHDIGITHEDPRLSLIDTLKSQGYRGKIVISTQKISDSKSMLERGASFVILPFYDAAQEAVEKIKKIIK